MSLLELGAEKSLAFSRCRSEIGTLKIRFILHSIFLTSGNLQVRMQSIFFFINSELCNVIDLISEYIYMLNVISEYMLNDLKQILVHPA